MMILNFSALFIFGLIFGSFLNVVILRYKPDRSFFLITPISGRSHCMSCGKTLAWYELVPLFSFMIQLGKCRSCGNRLSRQYPIVELATGFIFLTPLYFFSPIIPDSLFIIQSVIWTSIFLVFLVLAAIDYHWFIIPDELNVLIAVLGSVRIALDDFYGEFGYFTGAFVGNFSALFGLRENIWLNHLAGAAIGMAIIGLIIWGTKGRGMGWGDFKLAGALGILFGWPDIIFVVAFAFMIGAIYSLYVLASGEKGMKDSVPFGPFLVLGSLTLIFFGNDILRSYFGFFGF